VAVRHTTVNANWMAFFDDFTFTHVGDPDPAGVEALKADDGNGKTTLYNLNGVQVEEGRAVKGIYVVKTTNGQNVKTMRVVRK